MPTAQPTFGEAWNTLKTKYTAPGPTAVSPLATMGKSMLDLRQEGTNPYTTNDVGGSNFAMDMFQGPKFADLNNFSTSPYASKLSGFINDFGYKGGAYQAKDRMGEQMPEYDAMRARLESQYKREGQTAQENQSRQFAALGGGPSGAAIKQTQILDDQLARAKSEGMLGVDAQEAQARRGLQETENARAYESGEKARGYGFEADQAKLGGMNALGQLDLGFKTAQKEATNDEFNKIMARYQAKNSGGLFGGGGFLGLGGGY
jgi:hypothetical protein